MDFYPDGISTKTSIQNGFANFTSSTAGIGELHFHCSMKNNKAAILYILPGS